VVIIEFESGVLGVVESSFVSTYSPFALEVYGTEGAILVGGPDDGGMGAHAGRSRQD